MKSGPRWKPFDEGLGIEPSTPGSLLRVATLGRNAAGWSPSVRRSNHRLRSEDETSQAGRSALVSRRRARDGGDGVGSLRARGRRHRDREDQAHLARHDSSSTRAARRSTSTQGDKPPHFACLGGCLKAWPPLKATGTLKAGGGAKQADLGTVKGPGGKMVTYKGHPLYTFVSDTSANPTSGEGVNGFFVVSPSGSQDHEDLDHDDDHDHQHVERGRRWIRILSEWACRRMRRHGGRRMRRPPAGCMHPAVRTQATARRYTCVAHASKSAHSGTSTANACQTAPPVNVPAASERAATDEVVERVEVGDHPHPLGAER